MHTYSSVTLMQVAQDIDTEAKFQNDLLNQLVCSYSRCQSRYFSFRFHGGVVCGWGALGQTVTRKNYLAYYGVFVVNEVIA